MTAAPKTCPRCGTMTDALVSVEPGMRIALQEAGPQDGKPVTDQVCQSCFEQLTSSVSQGLKLRMERDIREKNKSLMWKNRTNLIKAARTMMAQKAYSEAAVQYEKYIRVLEVIFNLKKGELTPAVFNNSSRSKELTVIASVYWDLMRIYDQSPRYGERMQKASEKLAAFLPYSTIYPDIVKQAEGYLRGAKNPNVIRGFLRATKSSRGPCFIASAAYLDEPYAVELFWLREFRDQKLRVTPWGRQLVWFYYQTSPFVAHFLKQSALGQKSAKWALGKIASRVRNSF